MTNDPNCKWAESVQDIMRGLGLDPRKLEHEYQHSTIVSGDRFLVERYPMVWTAFLARNKLLT
jgi:hypothetical protein